jgi:hypothetical protein
MEPCPHLLLPVAFCVSLLLSPSSPSLSLQRVRFFSSAPLLRRKDRGPAGRSLGSCVTKRRLTSDIRRCYPIGCGRTTEPNKYYATAATGAA